MSLKEADKILNEYTQPNSMNSGTHSTIDNGNLFFAATEYQKAWHELSTKYISISDKFVDRVNEVIELK